MPESLFSRRQRWSQTQGLVWTYYCGFAVLTVWLWWLADPSWREPDTGAGKTKAHNDPTGLSLTWPQGQLSVSGRTVHLEGRASSYPPTGLTQITEPTFRVDNSDWNWVGKADGLRTLKTGELLLSGDVRVSGQTRADTSAGYGQSVHQLRMSGEQIHINISQMRIHNNAGCRLVLNGRWRFKSGSCNADLETGRLILSGNVQSSF